MYLCMTNNRLSLGSHPPPDPNADPGIFEGFFNIASRAFFHSLAYISGESDRISMKILSQVYPWAGKSLLSFVSNPDPQSGSEVGIQTIFSLADVCGLWLLLFLLYERAHFVPVLLILARYLSLYGKTWSHHPPFVTVRAETRTTEHYSNSTNTPILLTKW